MAGKSGGRGKGRREVKGGEEKRRDEERQKGKGRRRVEKKRNIGEGRRRRGGRGGEAGGDTSRTPSTPISWLKSDTRTAASDKSDGCSLYLRTDARFSRITTFSPSPFSRGVFGSEIARSSKARS